MVKLRAWLPLFVIVAIYCAVGALFSTRLPPWQTPDEPAHYNYIRQLAATGAYPKIEPGDYNQSLIEKRIAPPNAHLPEAFAELPGVQYEDHQPPLFYTLAAPVFSAFNGHLAPLRLLSLFFGAFTLVFAYAALQALFPDWPGFAALAVAFIALLPQHLYMMAGLNNDALAEALIALTLWLCALYLSKATPARRLALAAAVGLAMLTKATAYLALPVAVLAIGLAHWGERAKSAAAWAVRPASAGLVSMLIALPWWVHSVSLYGGADFLGLQQHDRVVVGQLTTQQQLANVGFGKLALDLLQTTFQSFWGQFGWMSIPMDRRFYLVLLVFTAVSAALFLRWWVRRRQELALPQSRALSVFAALALGAALAFGWYNLKFVQNQGRYLYPALLPIATGKALGWYPVLQRLSARLAAWAWLPFAALFASFDVFLLFRVILRAMQ